MSQQQIAIISKDVNKYLINNLISNYKYPIIIVTPNEKIDKIEDAEVLDDNLFLNRKKFFEKCKHKRPGWLYQQFLKYQIVLKSDYENTLIIDGDSLIKDNKFIKKNKLYYTPKTIEKKYINFISKNLGKDYVVDKNYITNQMNFNKKTLLSMIDTAFGSSEKYFDIIMDYLIQNPDSEFSEYQCYAAWAHQKINPSSDMIKVFRRHDLIDESPINSLDKYDLIAFEYGHKSGLLRTIRAKILYSMGANLG